MSHASDVRPTVSVVTPCFNEAGNLAAFHERLVAAFANSDPSSSG